MSDQPVLFPEAAPRGLTEAVEEARAILDAAIAEHNPSHMFAMFSGGHDSLVATHIASQHPRFSGAVTLFTGIGVKRTRRFVYETCRAYGWPLRVYRPRLGNRYHEQVLAHGFPGPFHHRKMYNRLKERSLERLIREHKRSRTDRIMLVTGVRKQESRRRMGHIVAVQRISARVWTAPIVNFSTSEKYDYMAHFGLPRNPVVDLLCMSGECLCGAFAKPNELDEVRLWFPDEAARIDALSEAARAAGVPSTWGVRPQTADTQRERRGQVNAFTGAMCFSCDAKLEALADSQVGEAA